MPILEDLILHLLFAQAGLQVAYIINQLIKTLMPLLTGYSFFLLFISLSANPY